MALELPPPLPPMSTVLGAIDREGRAAMRAAGRLNVAAVRAAMPARSGRARSGQRSSVRREGLGFVLEVSPSSRVRYPNGVSVRQVTEWLEEGTGLYGPRHRWITPRRARAFRLPGGWNAERVRGQTARHIYARVRTSEEAATERLIASGAPSAARAAEDALGGHYL